MHSVQSCTHTHTVNQALCVHCTRFLMISIIYEDVYSIDSRDTNTISLTHVTVVFITVQGGLSALIYFIL